MRNYITLLGLHYRIHGEPGPLNGDQFAWGYDEASLLYYVNKFNEQLKIDQPAETWTFTYPNPPVKTYWTLDAQRFAKYVNMDAQIFFRNTRPGASTIPDPQLLDEVWVASEQGSPRAHFPTDLGTDGQRLRKGQTSKAGFALNYIGKLFFLTSDARYFALFLALKQHKLSANEALTQAKEIEQAAG